MWMGCKTLLNYWGVIMAAIKKDGVSLNSKVIQHRGKIAAVQDQIDALKQQKSVLQSELAGLKEQKAKSKGAK